ncbi:MAG: class I SAM-dependent methyltransferase [Lacrimispora sp.]|uniref:class I SAM-dependent methyltransferase n=1 Tax=Lacrimispora sp. TaxID=2719234 RepID=UPI0039E2EA64
MAVKLDGVMETLLITLYVRAKDAASAAPVLNDQKAAEIAAEIDYDFSKFDSGFMSYYGVLARAKTMDDQARAFIRRHPECTIVSVGCGLDTRFSRVDNGKIMWYNLDFPEVIEQRKLFFEDHPRVKDISKSALDPSWTLDVEVRGKHLLIISEGMLMFLHEREVAQFLGILTRGFDRFEAHFDLLYKGLVNKGGLHDTVKKTGAQFHWGVKDGSEITRLCPGIKQIGLINFTEEMRHLLPGVKKLLIPMMYIANNRLGMYAFKKKYNSEE